MIRNLAKVLLAAAAFASGQGAASDSPAMPIAVVAPRIAPSPLPAADVNWQAFDIGASETIFVTGGVDIGLGTTRLPRDSGNISLPSGGQILLTNPNGVTVIRGTLSASGGGSGSHISAVPEPAAPLMLLAGMALLAAVRRRPGR